MKSVLVKPALSKSILRIPIGRRIRRTGECQPPKERANLISICNKCGGSGDRFDAELDDWVSPTEPCPDCEGTGEVGPKELTGQERRSTTWAPESQS